MRKLKKRNDKLTIIYYIYKYATIQTPAIAHTPAKQVTASGKNHYQKRKKQNQKMLYS